MDLRHLRHFVAVAEERHFGRAAARLGIEQSPLSRSIRELEGQLNVRLLDRGARGSQLTLAGITLLEEARTLLAQARDLRTRVVHTQAVAAQRLRLGVCDAVATPQLSVCLSAVKALNRHLWIDIVSLATIDAIAALEAGTVDAAVTLNPPATTSITRTAGWNEQFAVIATRRSASDRETARTDVYTLLEASELLVADAWAPAAQHWLGELATPVQRNAPPVRPIGTVLGLLTATAASHNLALIPAGFETVLQGTGISIHKAIGRNPRLPVVLLHRTDQHHPGVITMCNVLKVRPWAVKPAAAAPAGTPDRS